MSWPATIEAKRLREANPYACFRSGAINAGQTDFVLLVVGVEDVEGIAVRNLDDLAG